MKRMLLVAAGILLLVAGGLYWYYFRPPVSSETNIDIGKVVINKVAFDVELADTPKRRSQGLAGREELASQEGMLFVYPHEDYYSFWMKDTLIPLDIIWISADREIVDFIEYAQPQGARRADQLPHYKPSQKAKYVLEVNGGTVSRIEGFKIGKKVEFE